MSNVPCSVCSEAPSLPHQPSRSSAALHARTRSTSGYDSVVKRDRSKQGSPKKSGRTRSSKQPSRHQTLWVDGGFRRVACRSAVHGCAVAAHSCTMKHFARAIFYGLSPAPCCLSPPWRAHLYQQLCAARQVLKTPFAYALARTLAPNPCVRRFSRSRHAASHSSRIACHRALGILQQARCAKPDVTVRRSGHHRDADPSCERRPRAHDCRRPRRRERVPLDPGAQGGVAPRRRPDRWPLQARLGRGDRRAPADRPGGHRRRGTRRYPGGSHPRRSPTAELPRLSRRPLLRLERGCLLGLPVPRPDRRTEAPGSRHHL